MTTQTLDRATLSPEADPKETIQLVESIGKARQDILEQVRKVIVGRTK